MSKTIDSPAVLREVKVDQADAEYQKLARKLGVTISDTPSDKLLEHVLTTLSIAVYDLSAVRRYLVSKRPNDHLFAWIPISAKQEVSSALLALYPRRANDGWSSSGRQLHGHVFKNMVYSKPIPFPVLLTMDNIITEAKKLGFKPTFFVSDYVKADKPVRLRVDPFLAVGTSDSNALFVIERWDEPGFREEVYSTKKKTRKRSTGKTTGTAVKK